jgi:hypothetical protein
VQPPTVVENLYVFGDREPRSRFRVESLTVVHLILQGGEERFGGGVVPTDSRSTDTGQQVMVSAESVEFGRGVLAAMPLS